MTEHKIRPVSDFVVVVRDKAPTHTDGGLEIPEAARERRPETATVLAVGPGYRTSRDVFVPTTLKPGDRVVVSKYHGLDWNAQYQATKAAPGGFTVGDVVVVREREVFAVIESLCNSLPDRSASISNPTPSANTLCAANAVAHSLTPPPTYPEALRTKRQR